MGVILVLVGPLGCGKTTFASHLGPVVPKATGRGNARTPMHELIGCGGDARHWRRVCQDVLGSRDACCSVAAACLQSGLSVLVDRTNYDAEQREPWLKLAVEHGAQCHALVFDIPPSLCCERVRARTGHEGKVQGQAGGGIVMKLHSFMMPVRKIEGFHRV